MDPDHAPTVAQAVKDYLAAERVRNGKTETNAAAAQRYSRATAELHRFVRVIGQWDKTVDQLNAPDIADYGAREVCKGGDFEARLRPVKEFLDYLKKRGWHKDSLSVHMKIPRPAVPKGEKRTAAVGVQPLEVTKTGLEARKKELEVLKAQRPRSSPRSEPPPPTRITGRTLRSTPPARSRAKSRRASANSKRRSAAARSCRRREGRRER